MAVVACVPSVAFVATVASVESVENVETLNQTKTNRPALEQLSGIYRFVFQRLTVHRRCLFSFEVSQKKHHLSSFNKPLCQQPSSMEAEFISTKRLQSGCVLSKVAGTIGETGLVIVS